MADQEAAQGFKPGMFSRPDRVHSPLHVVCTLFNSARYRSRWDLYEPFAKMVHDAGAVLHTVEVAFGDRDHAVPEYAPAMDSATPSWVPTPQHQYTRLRTKSEIWHKESSQNVGVTRLPHDAEYILFLDADVRFVRPDWAGAIVQALQHYAVLQPWSEALDLTHDFRPHQTHKSFAACFREGDQRNPTGHRPYYGGPVQPGKTHLWHPGFAWAWRRDALDAVGGQIDFAIAGAGDHHQAQALIGEVDRSFHPKAHPGYVRRLHEWQALAEREIRRNIGFIPGLITHAHHGPKRSRQYWQRWRILVDNGFNPDVDLKRDWQGLYQLVDDGSARSRNLRDQLRTYFASRNEDDPNT